MPESRAKLGPTVLVNSLLAAYCGVGSFLAAWGGCGWLLRNGGWLLALPASVMIARLLFHLWHAARRQWRASKGALSEGTGRRKWKRAELEGIVLCSLVFFVGWGIGQQGRKALARRVCRRCEPVLEALEDYRLEHGVYPATLSSVPGLEEILSNAGISVREGRFLEQGISLYGIDEAHATLYLEQGRYLCLVPVERTPLTSFTRFCVYFRGSRRDAWEVDLMSWTLRPE